MTSEITLRKLSKLSKFSISTVSKALNNSHEISDRTKQKICGLAKKFNYVPNNSAIALRSRKTKIIAVIVPEIASIFFSTMISKIQNMAFNKGYRVLILESFFCEKRELECISTISDGCVDGVIIIKALQKSSGSFDNVSRLLGNYRLPTVIQKVNEFAINTLEGKCMAEKYFGELLTKINSIKNN